MTDAEADRRAIEAVHEEYLRVNGLIDPEGLRKIWSADPTNQYFNLSGHNYQGLEHWLRLWDYYTPRLRITKPWRSFNRLVRVEGDVGWITCERSVELHSDGTEDVPPWEGEVRSRSTEIYHREPDGWKVVHAHYSEMSDAPRPGGI
jgi:ketosteroid isomerase-like protein